MEESPDRLETALACSVDPPDSIGTNSPRIWLTSYCGPSWGTPSLTPRLLDSVFQLLQSITVGESRQIAPMLVPFT